MKRLLLPVLALIVLTLAQCGQTPAKKQEAQVKTVNVETVMIQPMAFSNYLRLVGITEGANDIRLSAEVSGRIEKYAVEKGAYVQKGDLIAQIDDARLQQEYVRLKALTEQAEQLYQRQKRIWEEDSIGSEIEYLNAKYNYQQRKASLQSLAIQLDNTKITAPFDARIENILLEDGEMASPGVPLVRLIAADVMKISAGVPARYSEVVSSSESVEIWFETQSSDTLQGDITFVGNSIDQQSRTFEIEIILPNREHQYKIGMIANLKLRTLYRPESIVVGEEFIYEKANQNMTYLVSRDANGQYVAKAQPVKLGPRQNNEVLIEQGLSPGDQLITIGSAFLEDGMRIEVVSRQS